MAIIIKTALLASLSIILLAVSTTPMVKTIDVYAEAYDSVDDDAQVYVSDNSETTMKRRKQAGQILSILVMQTITRWWITKTSLV